jgi:hypothetical protein
MQIFVLLLVSACRAPALNIFILNIKKLKGFYSDSILYQYHTYPAGPLRPAKKTSLS